MEPQLRSLPRTRPRGCLSGLWSDYTREPLAKCLPVEHVAPGCRRCNLLCDVRTCPPCLLHGAHMRSCLQKGCVRLGKVIRPPGSIATCRLSRPEMPASGPRPRAVPGQAGCVCVAGRAGGVLALLRLLAGVDTHARAKRKFYVYDPLCCAIWPAASLWGRRKHRADKAAFFPADPEATPCPAAGGRACDCATEKQRMDFSIRLAFPGPWLLQGPFPESQYPIPTHHFFWIPESRCQRTQSCRVAVTLGRPLFPTCREQP